MVIQQTISTPTITLQESMVIKERETDWTEKMK